MGPAGRPAARRAAGCRPSPPPDNPGPGPPLLPPAQGFIRPSSRAILVDAATPAELLDKLARYQPPPSLVKLAAEGKLDMHQRG